MDIDNIRRVLEENPQERTRRLSEELCASKDNIHRQIKTLGKSYSSYKLIPHELTPQQAQRNVDICYQLSVIPWMIDLSGVIKNGLLPQP